MTSARLAAAPFPLTADPRAYVPRAASESALRALERALSEGRCGILTGPTGVGKTTLLHVLDARLGREVRSVYVPNGTLKLDDVCRWVLGMLGESSGDNPREALLAVLRQLGRAGQKLLLLLDDASEPALGAASGLASLSEEVGGTLRLIVVPARTGSAGRLAEMLGAGATCVDFSVPMTAAETAVLVHHRLASTGFPKELRARFDAATIDRIHRAASGNARLVGLVASEILWPDRPGQGVEGPGAQEPAEPPEESPSVALPEADPVTVPDEASSTGPSQAGPAVTENRPRLEEAVSGSLEQPSRRLGVLAKPATVASLGLVLLLLGIATFLWLGPPDEPSSSYSAFASRADTGLRQEVERAGAALPDPAPPKPQASIAKQQLALAVPASAKEALQRRGEAPPEVGVGVGSAGATESESSHPPDVAEPAVPSLATDARAKPELQEPGEEVPRRVTASRETPRQGVAPPVSSTPVTKAPAPPVPQSARMAPPAPVPSKPQAPIAKQQLALAVPAPATETLQRRGQTQPEASAGPLSVGTTEPENVRLPESAKPAVLSPATDARPKPELQEPGEKVPRRVAASRETPRQAVAPPVSSTPVTEARAPAVTENAKVLIYVNATPWAHIEMDGKEIGVTPLGNLPVAPGEHHFRALLPDGREIERTVLVSQEERHFGFSADSGDR